MIHAHEISRDYPDYDASETTAKFEHAKKDSPGPTTCEYISQDLSGGEYCLGCPFAGRIKSPVVLGKSSPLLRDYAYIGDINRFIRFDDKKLFSKESFSDLHQHKGFKGKPADAVLKSPLLLKVESKVYRPGEEGLIKVNNRPLLNLWKRPSVMPQEGDPGTYLKHLEYLFPEPKERLHAMDYFAHMLQFPGTKLKHMLVIGGRQGTGKSYLGHVMKKLLGQSNVQCVDAQRLQDNFNGWSEDRQLLIFEEMMHYGRLELNNKLKTLITEEKWQINEKYVPAHNAETPRGIIAFSNHRVPIYMEESDRRYFVSFSNEAPLDKGYYDHLWSWTEENPGVILKYLLDRDLSHFNSNAPPPLTQAKEYVMTSSLTPIQHEIKQRIESEEVPFHVDVVTVDKVKRSLSISDECRVTKKTVSEALERYATPLGPVRVNGSRPRMYAVRNAAHWKQAKDREIEEHINSVRANPYKLAS